MSRPLVSVIIAVKNSQGTMRRCLDSVLASAYEPFEVIVVDDGSSDGTPQILQGYKDKITVITNGSSLGPAKARNIASLEAHGEFIAFTDGDCIVEKDWLDQLIQGLTQNKAVSCGGAQKLPSDATRFERDVFAFLERAGFITDYVKTSQDSRIRCVAHNPSCSVIYRRDVFLESKGFMEGLWPGEDVDLDRRLTEKGFLHAFNPDAVVYHYRPRALKAFMSMMKRYGCAQGFLVRKFGLFRAVHFVPVAVTLYLLGAIWCLFAAPSVSAAVMAVLLLIGILYFRSLSVFWLAFLGLFEWYEGFVIGFARPGSVLRK